MPSRTLEWKTDQTLAVGKGAIVQQFVALLGDDRLEIDVAPWGEGRFRFNGREIAHVDDAKTGAKPSGRSRKLQITTWTRT
jgi:enoyl-[acyl-carrier protein] reductase I